MKNHIKLSAKAQNKLKALKKAGLPELRAEYVSAAAQFSTSQAQVAS